MKKYRGKRTQETVTVEVVRDDTHGRKHARNLRHIPFHSPTGLSWGYEGSGPADLALAILVDYLKERPPRTGWLAGEKFARWSVHSTAFKHHQYFKRDFITKFADEWELTDTQIQAWLERKEKDNDSNTHHAQRGGTDWEG